MCLNSIEQLEQRSTSHSRVSATASERAKKLLSSKSYETTMSSDLPFRKFPIRSRVFIGHSFPVTVYAAQENPNTLLSPPKERE